ARRWAKPALAQELGATREALGVLWTALGRHLSACRELRGQDSQGDQARRSARRAAHQVRVGGQPEGRQGARAHHPAVAAAPGRRSDPVVDRRTFLGALTGGLLAAPLAEAQQIGSVYRIGYLSSGSPRTSPHLLAAFRQGLGELGWVEGKNITIDYRFAEG